MSFALNLKGCWKYSTLLHGIAILSPAPVSRQFKAYYGGPSRILNCFYLNLGTTASHQSVGLRTPPNTFNYRGAIKERESLPTGQTRARSSVAGSGKRRLIEKSPASGSATSERKPESMAEASLGVKVGFIGAGQMAEAMARGFSKAGVVPASQQFATDPSEARREVFKGFGVTAVEKNVEVAEKSDVIFLAVKPYVVKKVLEDLRSTLTDRHLIVSIAAGVTLEQLQAAAGKGARIVRVMPNTPCLVGETAAALALGLHATKEDGELVQKLFAAVGLVHVVPENLLDAVTGLSGSGPAYVFIAIEALADGGVAAGLPRDIALSLAAQTVKGAAEMVLQTGKHPGVLKDSVASPGGTTIAGIHELEKGGVRSTLMNAVLAAADRSKELSK